MTQHLVYQGKEKRERKTVVVDRELEKIYRRHRVVTVDVVLKEASKENHPLHSFFEWDDQAAAQKYRTVQCYSLILASKFVVSLIENETVTPKQIKGTAQVRKLLSTYRGAGFRLRTDVLKDAESRAAVIESKRSQLRSWCDSVIDISELGELRDSILAKLCNG